jgi:hypothetical protein
MGTQIMGVDHFVSFLPEGFKSTWESRKNNKIEAHAVNNAIPKKYCNS